MISAPTASQIEFYRENGFIVIENFLSPDELELWRQNTDEAVRERLEAKGPGERTDFYSQVFIQCIRLADTHAGMRKIMYDSELARLAAELAGVDGFRIWHDQALIKQPYGNQTAWHIDNPYWSFDSPSAISIWVALDDATLANGCLWYLPGTHRTARYVTSVIGANMRDLFKEYPEWEQLEAVPAACPAGSAVFHNGLTAHAAGANMTPRARRAMTCGYMPEGSTFNGKRNILQEPYFSSLKIGDVLDNDQQNPLVWHQT